MDIDRVELDALYFLYGFRKRKSTNRNVYVYTYRSGYFNNADIVPLTPDTETDTDFEQYRKTGFACTVRNYSSLEDAQAELFKGFFSLSNTRERFKAEAKRFSDRQTELLGSPYKYIPPPYSDSYNTDSDHTEEPLVQRLADGLSDSFPRLTIIEAAAGYGKTCTSYEVVQLALREYRNNIPFLIELSRNRQAKIFRYVLLDEIDRVFPSLSMSLVEAQIANGNIILLIDGFDELLHRTESIASDYDEVEPMLETISDLLKDNAKIILTTRRTAIFSGDHFHTWMENHENDFKISRYSLKKPQLEDWLSYRQRELLELNNFPIHQLSNPVLLSFLSGQSEDSFSKLAINPDRLVRLYFDRLLERETDRQDLRMDIDEQYDVFINLATTMVSEDFTAEDHEYLQLQVLEGNKSLLTVVRNRYPTESRPTHDELATKLVSHALMDRKSEEGDRVGFVNDFVLGTFVGESVIKCDTDEWIAAEGFIEQAVSSFIPRASDYKLSLWNKLSFVLALLDIQFQITSDIALLGYPNRDIRDDTISDLQITHTTLGHPYTIDNCVFSGCEFNDTTFIVDGINNVTFVGCRFFSCTFTLHDKDTERNIYITGCTGDYKDFLDLVEVSGIEYAPDVLDELKDYKKKVLEQFWPIGRPHYRLRRQVVTLYKGNSNKERYLITQAIEALCKNDLLNVKGAFAELSTHNLQEIMRILGRGQ